MPAPITLRKAGPDGRCPRCSMFVGEAGCGCGIYPENWKEFSRGSRVDRAGGRCECTGECGLHQPETFTWERGKHSVSVPRRCAEMNGTPAVFARGMVVLTTAHLCECSPLCAIPEHVKAMCNRCHLRIDVELHVKRAAANRMRKKESAGQTVMEW